MQKIAIFSLKSGAGITTSALNLAAAAIRQRRQVILMDMDPQAPLTAMHHYIGLDPHKHVYDHFASSTLLAELMQPLRANMHLIAAHAALAKLAEEIGRGPAALQRLSQGLQSLAHTHPAAHVIMDCCPAPGVVSLNAIVASDLVLVPVSADYHSIHAAVKTEKALDALTPVLKRRIRRRYLLTRADKRKTMTHDVEQELRRLFGRQLLITQISEHAALAEGMRMGRHVFEVEAGSPGAREYMALHFELQDALKQLD